MDRIKIGQIGICHEHAAAKVSALRQLSDVYELVGVVDDRQSREARFAGNNLEPYAGLSWMTEEELLATPDLRAVAIETANADLIPTALRCMQRGLHMHLDKPGGETLAPFEQLIKGCAERGLALQMGYMLRTNPAIQFCHRAVRENWLGDLFEIQAGMSHNYGGDAYQDYLGEFKGGILYNLGGHLVDVVVSLLGTPDRVIPVLKSTSDVAPGILNHGLALLEYPHATATLRACSREVDGLNHRRMTLCGTRGTIEWQPLERQDGSPIELRLSLLEANDSFAAGTHTVPLKGVPNRYREQLLQLARIIRGEIENPYPYRHELLVQAVLLAAAGYTPWPGGRCEPLASDRN